MATTPGRKFYDDQLAYLLSGDVDGLIDDHYTEDAALISFNTIVKGRKALKAHFREYLKMLGDLQVKSTDQFTETDDTIFFEATVTSNLGEARVYDALVLRDGKIAYHFTGVM